MINFLFGDSRFFWPENVKYLVHLPFAWDASLNSGLGIADTNTISVTSFLNLTASLSYLGLSWNIINLFFWIIPIILISFFSSFFLFKKKVGGPTIFSFIAGIVFSTNTYFLSAFLGGQFGVSFAVALMPFVALVFLNLFSDKNYKRSIIAGLVLSLQVLFDPRFALLTLVCLLILYFVYAKFSKKDLVYLLLIPLIIVISLHLFWIIPLIIFRPPLLPPGYDSVAGAKFFSFAFLENSISLLHPNWPENVFGKAYFMRPEFLMIPIIAFASLIFVGREKFEKKRLVLSFAIIAIVGAFFGKGANDPFGWVFLWVFDKVPGGSFFRDSTKFYSLIALAYSFLIPYAIYSFSQKLKTKNLKKLVPIAFIFFWIFTLRLIFSPNTHSIKVRNIDNGYIQLKDLILNQHQYFRTLWVPSWQRYGFFTDENPAIGRGEIFKEASVSGMLGELKNANFEHLLQDMSVKYVIVPYDSEGEIFVNDRKYDEKSYLSTVAGLSKVTYLKELPGFGKIHVFQVRNPRDHFWSPSASIRIKYEFVNPTKYLVNVRNANKGDLLVFSEGYDKNWVAISSDFKVRSSKFETRLNSFVLPKSGSYTFIISYEPQRWVYIGLIASSLSFMTIIFLLLKHKKK